MALLSFNLLDAEGNPTEVFANEAVTGEGVSPRSNYYAAKGDFSKEIHSHLTRNKKPFTYKNVAASGTFVCPVNFNGRVEPDKFTKVEFLDHILCLEAGVIIQKAVTKGQVHPGDKTSLVLVDSERAPQCPASTSRKDAKKWGIPVMSYARFIATYYRLK